MNKLLIVIPFIIFTSFSWAQKIINHNVNFSSGQQYMWGAALNPNSKIAEVTLFNEPWLTNANTGNSGISSFNVLGQNMSFGGGFNGSFSGRLGSDLKIRDFFNSGSVEVKYPIDVQLQMPLDETYDQGDIVEVETSYTIGDDWDILSEFPQNGEIVWGVFFQLAASASSSLCFFGCQSFTLIPSFNTGTQRVNIFTIDSNVADLSLDALEITGNVKMPEVNVNTTYNASNGKLRAVGKDNYFSTSVELFKLLGKLLQFTPVGEQLDKLKGEQSLGLATVDWTFLTAEFNTNIYNKQVFKFEPSLFGKFEFPMPVDYEIINPSTSQIVSTDRSAIIHFDLGQTIRYKFPCHSDSLAITPSYNIEGLFSNHTYDSLTFALDIRALKFGIHVPAKTLLEPKTIAPICISVPKLSWSGIKPKIKWEKKCTPEVKIPGIGYNGLNITQGPKYQKHIPAGQKKYDWFKDEWMLDGFGEQTFAPFYMKPNKLQISSSKEDLTCFGESNGKIDVTINAVSHALPYHYSWTNGVNIQNSSSSETLENLEAGPYFLSVIDANNCQLITGETIMEPENIVVEQYVNNKSCFDGVNDGFIELVVSGGTPPYSYFWSNGASSSSIYNLDAGQYDVTIRDLNDCEKTMSFEIISPPQLTYVSNKHDVLCHGDATGEILIQEIGGLPPYSVNWNTSASGNSLNNLEAGTYEFTLSDSQGCSKDGSIEIIQPSAPLNVTLSKSDVLCYGENTGSCSAEISGGEAPFTLRWSSLNQGVLAETSTILSNKQAGLYTLEVKDKNNCTSTQSITINQPAFPITSNEVVQHVNCFGINDGNINPNISGGTEPYQFNWSTGISSSIISNLSGGAVTLDVLDFNNCSTSFDYFIESPEKVLTIDALKTDVLCKGDNTGNISVTIDGGTPSYDIEWANGANTAELENLHAGSYSVLVKDANNCETESIVIIEEPAENIQLTSAITNVLCYGESTGAIELVVTGGTGSFTYQWENENNVFLSASGSQLNGLSAGSYGVNIKDENNCESISFFEIQQPQEPLTSSVSSTNVTCFNEENGTITLDVSGGTIPYSFEWSTGELSQNLASLPAGAYSVLVTDANDCAISSQAVVTQPSAPLIASTFGQDVKCFGDNNGSVNSFVSGGTAPYQFDWSNGASTPTIQNLPVGVYSLQLTDANGCQAFSGAVIGQPSELFIDVTSEDVSCFNYEDGQIVVNVEGGKLPYFFAWGNENSILLNNPSETISELRAAEYLVRVRDNNNCVKSETIFINQPDIFTSSVTIENTSCKDFSDGGATVEVEGGVAPYSITWDDGNSDFSISSYPKGTYSYLVEDNQGCTNRGQAIIGEPNALVGEGQVFETSCADKSDGQIVVSASGGTFPFSFTWSSGQNTSQIDQLESGNYTVFIEDDNGCQLSLDFTIPFNQEECLVIPNTFTPNGDNYNDTWIIGDAEFYDDLEVHVFNKWGEEIFTSKGEYEPWDGTFKGSPLPAGVYYYVIYLRDAENTKFTGSITIIR